ALRACRPLYDLPSCWIVAPHCPASYLYFFQLPSTTEIYTLSLHDALPISPARPGRAEFGDVGREHADVDVVELRAAAPQPAAELDRKSTRLNSSHQIISYAVFCLKKKKTSPKYRAQASTQECQCQSCTNRA